MSKNVKKTFLARDGFIAETYDVKFNLKKLEKICKTIGFENNIYQKMHRSTAKNEFRSWENSLEYMYKVLNDDAIPGEAGVAIEYNIPQTSKRIDFIISGYDKHDVPNVVIIELKQWDQLKEVVGEDALVETFTGNAERKVVHPSYQAWSYSMLIRDYNKTVQEEGIRLFPCAYLHNYRRKADDPLDAQQYQDYLMSQECQGLK